MPDYKTKVSFIDHLTDGYYSFTLFIFIILLVSITHLFKEANKPGMVNFLNYVLFGGIVSIVLFAYLKRYYEVNNNISEKIKWSWISVSLIVYSLLLFFSRYVNYKDDNFLELFYNYIGNDGLSLFLIASPIVLLLLLLLFKRKKDDFFLTNTNIEPSQFNFILKLISSIVIFSMPILLMYLMLFVTDFEKDFPYTAIILSIILTFIFIAIVMIVFNVSKNLIFPTDKINTGHNKISFFNLFKYILLYIPCLITEFVDYLKYEYKITTNSSLYTLLITFVIILLYVVIPKLREYVYNYGSIQLLKGPVYLNEYRRLGSFEIINNVSDFDDNPEPLELKFFNKSLKIKYQEIKNLDIFNTSIFNYSNDGIHDDSVDDNAVINSSDKKFNVFNYTYCLSFWVNINPQPPNTAPAYNDYVSLFNYGKKPEIMYKASNNHLLIKMIQGKDGEDIIYKSKDSKEFGLQKWNHFCINYNKGTLDVFLNNKLIATKSSIVPYVKSDVVSCGSHGGIQGGICNIKYYNRTLTKNQLYTEYESFKNKNPPII